MNYGKEKHIGWEFIKRLRSKSKDKELFKTTIKEFASDSPENRNAVAMGLLAIGKDWCETAFDRNFALYELGMILRTCGLRNNKELREQLNAIIDDWVFSLTKQSVKVREECAPNPTFARTIPWGALWALGALNRQFGLEKCEQLVKYFGESNAGRQVLKLRNDLERLNSLEM